MKSEMQICTLSSSTILFLILTTLLMAAFPATSKFLSLIILPLTWLLMRFDKRPSVAFVSGLLLITGVVIGSFIHAGILMLSCCAAGVILLFNVIPNRQAANEPFWSADFQLYKDIFDTIVDPIVIAEKDTRKIFMANQKACEMLGYTKEEIRKIAIDRIHPPDSLRFVLQAFEKLANRETEYAKDVLVKAKNGELFYVDISAKPIRLSGKQMLLGVFRDVTERKQTEDELKQIKFAIDSTSDGIGMSTPQGHHFYQNKAYTKMFGFTLEEFDGRYPIETIFPDTNTGREIFNTIMSGNSWRGELNMRTKDGRRLPVLLLADAVKDETGKVVAFIGVHTDISEQKKTEERLIRSEEKYRNIFENAMEGIFQTTLDGRLVSGNPALAMLAGYDSQEEMIQDNQAFQDKIYVHPEKRQQLMEILKKQGAIKGFEFEAYNRNKEVVWVSLNARLVRDRDGGTANIEGTLSDITYRKKAEADKANLEIMLAHSQKLESIGRLAGGVAHDFNNLLTTILGNTELAMQALSPDQGIYERLATIRKAAERAAEITRQLLAFSRKQIVEPKIIDLNALIHHLSKVVTTLIGEKIELKLMLCKTLYSFNSDPVNIEQIIINLAANARDAMPNGGLLQIETANVRLSEKDCIRYEDVSAGEYVMLAISDTGTGMDEETMRHLYEPFFTTKEKGKSMGLGLATVYGIVRQNGGLIEAYSEVNRGTTFQIYFPAIIHESKCVPREENGNGLPGGKETILLVEDNDDVLAFGYETLDFLGYKVIPASTGEEAVKLASDYHDHIDLLVTDVMLPGMNGREAAEKITAARPSMRVIYNSGYTAEAIDKQGILEKGLHFIQKPFTIKTLARKVRAVLDE